jgi:hypothetical protein
MKAWASVAMVLILGPLAHAESLGNVAKRERERREKKRDGVQAPVIGEQELVAGPGPGKASKGTFNPAAGTTGGRTKPAVAPPATTSTASPGVLRSDVDVKRAAARDRLEEAYDKIRDVAAVLLQAISDYEQCSVQVIPASKSCEAQLIHIGNLAMAVAAGMEDAEDAARQGWLTPGDVRDARRSHGMADSFWDALVRAVRKYLR